jgi:cbb3-type cytochrome oxidase subunit 3
MDMLTLYAFVLLALTILLVGLTGYLLGSSRSARRQLAERAREEEIAHELTHDEPAYERQPAAVAVPFEVVDLPPVTAPLAIVAPAPFAALPHREREEERDPVDMSAVPLVAYERDMLLREIEELRAELAHKEALRLRYLRKARAQTERVNFMLRLFADARRPPSKQALSSVKIDLPKGKQLALVPPSIASEWSELH